ncbi:MAG TPA: dATP pyrophosphohydrolase [Arenibaculum sp.]|nr:dATP pyrophosphohydrolase [Arenibaculum sp.]
MRVVPVDGRRALACFVRLPHRLFRDDPCYVPPLDLVVRQTLDPRANPWFRNAEARFWLALRDGRPVGRISAQVDADALALPDGAGIGHFGFLDAEDDADVFAALLGTAEDWLNRRGMRRVRGPFSLSINDECGVLVDGFDTPPMLMMGHARPYYGQRLTQAGYAGVKDLLAYSAGIGTALPDRGVRVLDRVGRTGRLTVRRLDLARYHDEIRTVVDIFNDAWAGNWGFVPLAGERLDHLAKSLKPLIAEDLVAIAEIDREPAAFMVVLPNVNEAIADLGGRLLPLGWAKLLWRLRTRRIRTARVPLMGVRRRHHATLLGAAAMIRMFEDLRAACRRHGIERAEMSWVLEDNRQLRHVTEGFGARVCKTYRLYEKAL